MRDRQHDNIWKSGRRGAFKVQRKSPNSFVVANRVGRAIPLTREELYDLAR
jgi:hypothetical protein